MQQCQIVMSRNIGQVAPVFYELNALPVTQATPSDTQNSDSDSPHSSQSSHLSPDTGRVMGVKKGRVQ